MGEWLPEITYPIGENTMRTITRLTLAAFVLAAIASPAGSSMATTQATATPNSRDMGMPRIGDCYDYGPKGMDRLTTPSPALSCSARHTAEVYKVARWTSSRSPYGMPEDALWRVANQKCAPNQSAAFRNDWFNYWAYFVPTRDQWDRGARWIRCDALRAVTSEPLQLMRWQGGRL